MILQQAALRLKPNCKHFFAELIGLPPLQWS